MHKLIQVAVGIIKNQDGKIFVTQRASGSHLAGFWEFPGGKIESNETAEQALYRELREEAGITAVKSRLIDVLSYRYPERDVNLHFYLIDAWHGEPQGCEGQASRWLAIRELNADEFPEANRPIIQKLVADCE